MNFRLPRALRGATLALVLCLLPLYAASPSQAAPPQPLRADMAAPAASSQDLDLGAQLRGADKTNPKLDSALAQLAEQGGAGLAAVAEGSGLVMRGDAVQVQISVDPAQIDAARQAVLNAGGEITKAADDASVIQGFVPTAALKALAADPAVQFVRRPVYFQAMGELQAGQLNTEGVAVSNATTWHNAGVRGAGVKVAVIDVGFEGYSSLLGSDLPANVTAVNFADTGTVTDGGPHGTACAEIVYDMAPGVQLMLLRIATNLDVEQAIDYAIQQGAKIISASIGTNGFTAGDGNNAFTAKVTQANNAGITYFNAAGNEREKHWGGTNLDGDNDGFIDFGPGDEINCIAFEVGTCPGLNPGFTLGAVLRWSDWSAPVDQDYDLYAVRDDGSGWQIIAKAEDVQNGGAGQAPVEVVQFTTFGDGASYGFAISYADASQPVYFDLFSFTGGFEQPSYDRSLTDQAASPNVVAVAALDSTAPYPQESYSSQGPALGPGGAQFGGISKPDISAFANVNTRAYGTTPGEKFNGTSSATPHVAGAAALVKGFYPSYTPTQVASFLTGRAVDIGASGRDTLFGTGRLWLGAAPTVTPPPATRVRFDFNADGKSDILWRHSSTGANSIWFMNGRTIVRGARIDELADVRWKIAGVGDFNGDSKSDILWRHSSTGANSIWFMNGSTILVKATINSNPDADWKIVGVGDFNGDNRSDIFWRHSSTGSNAIWFMSGRTLISSASMATTADVGWKVIGTGDFNGDRKADVLWRHSSTGANAIWFMNGRIINANAAIAGLPDTSWKPVSTGDFNGDRKADILWRHSGNGANAIWFMNGRVIGSSGRIFSIVDQNWKVASDGDYNGDGKADILWRNSSTGDNTIWFMNGLTRLVSVPMTRLADTRWQAGGTGIGTGSTAGPLSEDPAAIDAALTAEAEGELSAEPAATEGEEQMVIDYENQSAPDLSQEMTTLYLPLLSR